MHRTHFSSSLLLLLLAAACGQPQPPVASPSQVKTQRDMSIPLDPENIVSIAAASKDHTTLVAALKAADYVKSVANPGPLTVFAPTNDAFAKLPAGTVEGLLKPEAQAKLQEIIKYHATTSVYDQATLGKMAELPMANGKKVKLRMQDGKLFVNDAAVVASVRGSNGMVHIVDGVLLPPAN